MSWDEMSLYAAIFYCILKKKLFLKSAGSSTSVYVKQPNLNRVF